MPPKKQPKNDAGDCAKLCTHEVPYHGDEPCYADQRGDEAIPCVCPEHPETDPGRKPLEVIN